jgi:hypothetical protein
VVNSSTPILVNGSTPFDTAGAKLRYHGDFNWPDLRIATVMQLCGAVLWCFTGDDYGAAIERFKGAPPHYPIHGILASQMHAHGLFIAEAATIDALLNDLRFDVRL